MRDLTVTICLTIAVLFGSAGMSWSADFQKGTKPYITEHGATVLREWKPLAEQGNVAAQLALAGVYYIGSDLPQNYKKAVKWYRKAAQQGNASAQNSLGWMYAKREGVSQDYKEAVKWYRLAAEQGLADAQHRLGSMYENGNGVPQDFKAAVKWYSRAANLQRQGRHRRQESHSWTQGNYPPSPVAAAALKSLKGIKTKIKKAKDKKKRVAQKLAEEIKSKWNNYDSRDKTLSETVLNYTNTGTLKGSSNVFWLADKKNPCFLNVYGSTAEIQTTFGVMVNALDIRKINQTAFKISREFKQISIFLPQDWYYVIKSGSDVYFNVGAIHVELDRLQKAWRLLFAECPGKKSRF